MVDGVGPSGLPVFPEALATLQLQQDPLEGQPGDFVLEALAVKLVGESLEDLPEALETSNGGLPPEMLLVVGGPLQPVLRDPFELDLSRSREELHRSLLVELNNGRLAQIGFRSLVSSAFWSVGVSLKLAALHTTCAVAFQGSTRPLMGSSTQCL